jgi:hypothetical protein
MKRTLSLILTAAIATTISVAALPATATTKAEPNVAPSTTRAAFDSNRKKKPAVVPAKKCSDYCIEGTIPKGNVATFFADSNTKLILVNETSISVLDLDTRKIVATSSTFWRTNNISSASLGDDGQQLIVYSYGHGIYRVVIDTLTTVDVSPVSSDYPVNLATYYTIAAGNAGEGYFATASHTSSGDSELCHFGDDGTLLACTGQVYVFSGGTCGIEFNADHTVVYLISCDGSFHPVKAYSVSDMSSISMADPIANTEAIYGSSAVTDGGYIVLIAKYTSGPKINQYVIIQYNIADYSVLSRVDLPVGESADKIATAPDGTTYLLSFTTRGDSWTPHFAEVNFTSHAIENSLNMSSFKNGEPSRLSIDDHARYVIIGGNNLLGRVVSLSDRSDVIYAGTSRVCTVWHTWWDYLNLNLQTNLKNYHVRYDGGADVKDKIVAPGGTRTYTISDAGVGWFGDVYTIQSKPKNKWGPTSDVYVFPAGSPAPAHQPRC